VDLTREATFAGPDGAILSYIALGGEDAEIAYFLGLRA
jgi:hypothetical protein